MLSVKQIEQIDFSIILIFTLLHSVWIGLAFTRAKTNSYFSQRVTYKKGNKFDLVTKIIYNEAPKWKPLKADTNT